MGDFLVDLVSVGVAWIIFTFIKGLFAGIVMGSIVWFIGHLFFGVEWDYFSYVRGWIILEWVLYGLVGLYKLGN